MRRVAAVALAVGAMSLVAGPAAAQTGPPSSSFSTSAPGVAAYAALLEEFDYEVEQLRGPLVTADLDRDWTLVLLEPLPSETGGLSAVRSFVSAGGRLIAGGRDPEWVSQIVDRAPSWAPGGASSYSAEAFGLSTVETAGEGSWSGGDGEVLVGDAEEALAVEHPVGEGTVILLADVSPLQNRLLDHADNAAFGLSLAGDSPGPVVFAEGVHGYGPPSGLSALPLRLRWTLGGLAAAVGLWMWGRGRRLGPAEEPQRVLPPPRRAYVEALAATLARARRREGGNR